MKNAILLLWAMTAAGLAGGSLVTTGSTTVDPTAGHTSQPATAPEGLLPLDEELLQNPGFETGSLPPWTGYGWYAVTTYPHGGTYCAMDVGNLGITQVIDTTPGSAVQSITFWARQPDQPAAQAYDFFYDDGTYAEFVHFPTAQWGQFNVTGNLNRAKNLVAIRIWGYSGGGPGPDSTYIDDVSIQTYGPSYDAGVVSILAPEGVIESGQVVTPACSVRNFGNSVVSYNVRMKVGSGYNETTAVTGHAPYTTIYLTFPTAWVAAPPGRFAVSCSTELALDSVPANDKLTDSVAVVVHDVGVAAVLAPSGTFDTGAVVAPSARWHNNGSEPEDFTAWCVLVNPTGAREYVETLAVAGFAPGADTTIDFPGYNVGADTGQWTVRCSTRCAGDVLPANDTASGGFRVRLVSPPRPGWLEKASMPPLPSGRQVKDGGWLTFSSDNGLIYAAKGNKAADFYAYDPAKDSWQTLANWPDGTEAKKPSKGAVGCASSSGVIYATKGNNTQGFWKYVAAVDSWYQKKDVPLGPSGKKVKGGTDIVYAAGATPDSDYVYLLKGYKNEFWKYDVAHDSWTALPAAPLGTSGKDKYDKGSWLVLRDGPEPLLYAHKAKYHELFAYNAFRGVWTGQLTGMPLVGMMGKSKKSKDGGSAAPLGGFFYALKGGNTQEFWRYNPAVDSWKELDTMPQLGSTLKKKKVKAGADITAADFLYALKGNKTYEFWRYVPGIGAGEGVMAATFASPGRRLAIAPNPLRAGFANVHLDHRFLDSPSRVLSVYDAAGRVVLERADLGLQTPVPLDLRSLRAGVYLVRLTAGGHSAAQKLVVQR